MRCRDVMRDQISFCRADETIENCASFLALHPYLALLVVDDGGRVVGAVTAGDLEASRAETDAAESDAISTVVRTKLYCCDPRDDIRMVAFYMDEVEVPFLLVVDDGSLVGVVTESDVTASMTPQWNSWLE